MHISIRIPAFFLLLAWLLLQAAAPAAAGEFTRAKIIKVFDGDTILAEVDGVKEKVRLIGIDCPEAVENEKLERDLVKRQFFTAFRMLELGKKAKEFTEKACPPGSFVLLEKDEEERDRYGRLLAYVWIRAGKGAGREVMLNARLVRAGLAWVMTIPPNTRHAAEFENLEREAEDDMDGVWSY